MDRWIKYLSLSLSHANKNPRAEAKIKDRQDKTDTVGWRRLRVFPSRSIIGNPVFSTAMHDWYERVRIYWRNVEFIRSRYAMGVPHRNPPPLPVLSSRIPLLLQRRPYR